MTDTIHLGMPFIEGSQAQKHVTHNESLRILDAVVQIGVHDTDRTAPPSTPAEGDRHIVATGATGAWAGQANAVAAYEDSAWRFLTPRLGWCAWSEADAALLVYDGSAWIDVASGSGGGGGSESLARLGINDTASDPNLLTVKSNDVLLNAIDTGDGGAGDMRLQISKQASGKTASVVFSDSFSGRAEFGLVGSDAFKLKVSNDGATFVEALVIDQASGNAVLPRGLALTGVIAPSQITSNQNDYNPAGIASASVLNLSSDAMRSVTGLAGGAEGAILAIVNTGSQIIKLVNESASSTAVNRFALGSDLTISGKQAALLRYDGTAARWYALVRPGGREVLTANRTYYVRTDGSDNNDGLSNTSGGAFLTVQKAVDVAAFLDIAVSNVTIQLADGTYTASTIVTGPWMGSGTVTIQGNAGTPANVLVSITSGTAFSVLSGARLIVKDMKIQTTGGGTYCLYANGNGTINYANIDFGAAGNSHIRASDGGLITCDGAYTISGNASFHWRTVGTGVIRCAAKTVTLTGTPAFTTFSSATDLGAMVINNNTFSGSATGARYDATLNGVIDTAGGGSSYLPGNSAGTTATGGQYV